MAKKQKTNEKTNEECGTEQECITSCPLCKAQFTVTQLLEACTVAWTNQEWIYFICPECKGHSHVALRRGGEFAIGYIDGGPGPCFIESEKYCVPNMKFSIRNDAITVRIDEKIFRFTAKL
jgi:hypothetical protein